MPPCSPPSDPFNLFSITALSFFSTSHQCSCLLFPLSDVFNTFVSNISVLLSNLSLLCAFPLSLRYPSFSYWFFISLFSLFSAIYILFLQLPLISSRFLPLYCLFPSPPSLSPLVHQQINK